MRSCVNAQESGLPVRLGGVYLHLWRGRISAFDHASGRKARQSRTSRSRGTTREPDRSLDHLPLLSFAASSPLRTGLVSGRLLGGVRGARESTRPGFRRQISRTSPDGNMLDLPARSFWGFF